MKKTIGKLLKFISYTSSAGEKNYLNWIKKNYGGTIHKFKSGLKINEWEIPKEWSVIKAEILYDNKKIFDGSIHPLSVIGYSDSYIGKISLKDFKNNHIFSSNTRKNAYLFYWQNYYKNIHRWGFSIPYNEANKILKNKKNDLFINLQTQKKNGFMRMIDLYIKGESKYEIIFNAHTCHPCQANDDNSGVAILLNLYKNLKKKNNLYYSYRFIIGPELYAPIFYFNKFEKTSHIIGSVMVKAIGNNYRLGFQKSFDGETFIDFHMKNTLQANKVNHKSYKFRELYGNDEIVFESPGIEIPSISISRVKERPLTEFPEYHTSDDNLSIINEKMLDETLQILKNFIFSMEKDRIIINNYKNLIYLSSKKYNLFYKTNDSSTNTKLDSNSIKLHKLQTLLPMTLQKKNTSLCMLAAKFKIEKKTLKKFINNYINKKLIKIV